MKYFRSGVLLVQSNLQKNHYIQIFEFTRCGAALALFPHFVVSIISLLLYDFSETKVSINCDECFIKRKRVGKGVKKRMVVSE